MDYQIQIADASLLVIGGRVDLNLDYFFPHSNVKPSCQVLINWGSTIDDYALLNHEDGRTVLRLGLSQEDGVFHVFRYLAFAAGLSSGAYWSVHGAGLKVDEAGVLLMGKSGSGKSILSASLCGQILGDDMVMVSGREICRVGRLGHQTSPDKRYVNYLRDDVHTAPLSCVFVLDRGMQGGALVQIRPEDIPPEAGFDDKIHPSLLQYYASRLPFNLGCSAYRLGTADFGRAHAAIEELVR